MARGRTSTRKAGTTSRAASSAQPLVPGDGELLWVLDVPFEARSAATAAGARWDAARRLHVYLGASLPAELRSMLPVPFSPQAAAAAELGAAGAAIPEPTRRMSPREHQRQTGRLAVAAARAGLPGFVVMDEVGTGKTLSCLCAVLELAAVRPVRSVLVVAPLAVVPHWRATVADQGLVQQLEQLGDGRGASEGDGPVRVVVTNYERLKALLSVPSSAAAAKRTATRNRRIAREGAALHDWDVIVFDEAHKLKSYGTASPSQRAAAAATLAGYGRTDGDRPFVLWSSATIGQNPLELGYLAPLLAAARGVTVADLADFGAWLDRIGLNVQRNERFGSWTWEHDLEDLSLIRSWLFDGPVPLAVRRTLSFEKVSRIPVPVELEAGQRELYESAWSQFRREMELSRAGRDRAAGRVAQLRFRQKASLLRVPATVEQVCELLDNGRQVAVSVQFLETCDAIVAELAARKVACAVMDGRDLAGREQQRLAFQSGRCPVVVFTTVEGFSLHAGELLADGSVASGAPRVTVLHDMRFSAIDGVQLEGRAHRDGQVAPVLWMYAAGTVEQSVAATLLGRMRTMKDLAGEQPGLLDELERALDGLVPSDLAADPRQVDGVGAVLTA